MCAFYTLISPENHIRIWTMSNIILLYYNNILFPTSINPSINRRFTIQGKSINLRFTTHFIVKAASFILSNKLMNFYEMFYLETQETSMATHFAPAFATLSMRYLEM